MRCAVGGKIVIGLPSLRSLRLRESMDVVVVTRYPLAFVPQFSAAVVPLAQTVQDDDLVPERSLRLHRSDLADCEVQIRQIGRHVRRYCRGDVWVQRGFRASLDLDGGTNVVAFGCSDCDAEQQGLTVLVVGVCLQPETSSGNRSGRDVGELRSVNSTAM